MVEYSAAQERRNTTTEYQQKELQRMISENCGLQLVEEYYYDSTHHSSVLQQGKTCVILDYDLCTVEENTEKVFDYSKYCEMQNTWMLSSDRLYRFYVDTEMLSTGIVQGREISYEKEDADTGICAEINRWLKLDPENIEVSDDGGSFDKAHIDNTPLEKKFEDLFIDAYGHDSLDYLHKEYSISLNQGRNAFVDYVIETKSGTYAVEENGVRYHHPQIIHLAAYLRQLEKQNTLSLLGFKTYRFSFENLRFREQAIDSIKTFFGPKSGFRNAHLIKGTRPFALYTHQETFLQEMNEARRKGVTTSLIVSPTGSGKSQIAIEDIQELQSKGKINRVLVMVPSARIRTDWEKRLASYKDKLDIFLNKVQSAASQVELEEEFDVAEMAVKLYDKYGAMENEMVDFEYLSMGMTHDYITAMEEGSNLVRVGTAIFGARVY